MAYPDPPEFKWDRKIVEAYCSLGLRKAIGAQVPRDALQQGRVHHSLKKRSIRTCEKITSPVNTAF